MDFINFVAELPSAVVIIAALVIGVPAVGWLWVALSRRA